MKKLYYVVTPTGLNVLEGTKRDCQTYVKQANKKGAEKLYKLEIVEAEQETKKEVKTMKFYKINADGTRYKPSGSCNDYLPRDYTEETGQYRIINDSFDGEGWGLEYQGIEIGRYKTLKAAKAAAEEKEKSK